MIYVKHAINAELNDLDPLGRVRNEQQFKRNAVSVLIDVLPSKTMA